MPCITSDEFSGIPVCMKSHFQCQINDIIKEINKAAVNKDKMLYQPKSL